MSAYTFTTTVGSVTVKTTLYGDVTSERLLHERRQARHRAEQLQPVAAKPERVLRPRQRFDEDDPVWDKQSYQSTGR